MSDRPRDRNRKFAAGIDVSEEHFRHGLARFLAEVPAFENGLSFFRKIADRDRTAVEQKRDDRFARCGNRIDQLILTADQVERRAVAHVIERPGFARRLLVAADGQDNNIRLLRHFHGFRNAFAVLFGITGNDLVLLPGTADRYFAAFVIQHVDGAGAVANAFQNRAVVFGLSAVAAQQLDDPHSVR